MADTRKTDGLPVAEDDRTLSAEKYIRMRRAFRESLRLGLRGTPRSPLSHEDVDITALMNEIPLEAEADRG